MGLISPQIEKDLFEGKCEFKTINFGFQDSYTIPVPKGSFIILRQIFYNQFVVSPNNTGGSIYRRNLLQMSIAEKGKQSELVYIMKNYAAQVYSVYNASFNNDGAGMVQIETWNVFRNDVVIDLSLAPDLNTLAYQAADKFNSDSLEREQPLGYGVGATGVSITPLFSIGTQKFYLSGSKRTFVSNPFVNPYRDRLRFNTDINSRIPQATVPDLQIGTLFPLISFGYFEYKTEADKLI